jgi:hypothetical protein
MRVFAVLMVVATTIDGCTCRGGGAGRLADEAGVQPSTDGAGAGPREASVPAGPTSGAVFSAPIAAARMDHGEAVAGLVASESVIRAVGFPEQGPGWSTDVLASVSWTPDAELHLQRAGEGLALLWRGLRGGKSGRTVVLLGPDGKARGEPFAVGAAFCSTEEGGIWVVERPDGSSRVVARRWSAGESHDILMVSAEHDPPALVCADHTAIVLADGDDGLTAMAVTPGDTAVPRPTLVLRDSDFGDEEERDHEAYSVGDDLGLVRIGAGGSLALREVPRGGVPTPWRRVKRDIPPDDDIVAVDGDEAAVLLVVTHDADVACPGVGSTAAVVRALRIDRKTGDERLIDLAPADCAVTPGPFWISHSGEGQVVSWVERRARASADTAPISALAYRVIRADGVRSGTIDQPADAVAEAGCDGRGCAAAALVRAAGADAMQPSAIRMLRY